MVQTKTKSSRGPSGVATLRVMAKHVIVVLDGDEYSFNKDSEKVPEALLNAPIAKNSAAFDASVTISARGDQLFNVRPADGSHVVKFKNFTHKKDSPPVPKLIAAKFVPTDKGGFTIDEHLQCTAIFEIVGGKFKGMDLIYTMWYLWEDDGTGVALLEGFPKKLKENTDFLNEVGLDKEDVIPFSDNVLPYLEELILGYDGELIATLNGKGWIDNIGPLPGGVTFKTPKKKTTKKKKKAQETVS